ncbi:type II toxin-antitoxin system Phd/YefM family antitoxin [Piscinibacter sp.]|uniref:type II toxin-antitoxin system Phd/YefM family antitoxin n=1 Tax=Piscinibacter sp. TaxID=1903157 RepID=UPI002C050991|nr:type II toxin-antitoxin system prevent-host-death family antitoxin [Albitalea sp.]HUG26098.1 type II toxin-antitoxin system prevent-host-death family antitoxin [Albitalea sp.]
MKEVAVYEAKTRLSELLADVEQGEQVTITRHGRPIARLVSAVAAKRSPAGKRQQVAAVFAQLKARRVTMEGNLKELLSDGRD